MHTMSRTDRRRVTLPAPTQCSFEASIDSSTRRNEMRARNANEDYRDGGSNNDDGPLLSVGSDAVTHWLILLFAACSLTRSMEGTEREADGERERIACWTDCKAQKWHAHNTLDVECESVASQICSEKSFSFFPYLINVNALIPPRHSLHHSLHNRQRVCVSRVRARINETPLNRERERETVDGNAIPRRRAKIIINNQPALFATAASVFGTRRILCLDHRGNHSNILLPFLLMVN